MSTPKSIHIFKPGTHTAMSGATLGFTEHDLAASAQAYDPAVHEAPLVVGHPKTDSPAYGWVKSLQFADAALQAIPHQVDADFAELVNSGKFKKISASFYTPDSAANPVPGVYYLRHVGFLGAQPPAVKGLKQAEFADSDEGIVEFSEWDDVQVASLFRNLREWILGKFGAEEADQVIPQYTVQSLEQSAAEELAKEQQEQAMESTDGLLPNPSYTEPNPGDTMSADEKARLAELEAENARLKQQQADFAEQQKQAKNAANHAAHLNFAEDLVKQGRLLPAQKDLTVATLDYLAANETVVEFGEGDAKKPLLDAVKTDLFAKLPKVVEFGEVGTHDAEASTVNFAAPSDYAVDPAALQLHQQAEAYQAKHGTDYQTALHAVAKH
jgi:hypothetical protein